MDQEKTHVVKLILGVVFALILLVSSCGLLEINTNGFYKVKQSVTGEVTIINETGPFWQGWGDIFEYTNTNTLEYEVRDIRFNDGSVATSITGTVQVKMPLEVGLQLKLHKDYRGYQKAMSGLVEKLIFASMKQAATLMKAESFYSTRREEFRSLTENQMRYGIYETYVIDTVEKKGESNTDEVKVKIKLDKDGKYVISTKSLLPEYGIEINQLLIDTVIFDSVTEQLIAKRKEAEKAKQDRITAEEQGKAKVASAEADKLVEKIQAVTDAQKEFEVAEFNRKESEEKAKALLATGRAQAEADRLKVQAGLSPERRAEIDKETKIGIAAELAKVKFPDSLIISGGGDGRGGSINPFDAVGLKAFVEIQKELGTK